jgi:hypothetical protein
MAVLTIWIDESGDFVTAGDHVIAAVWSLGPHWDVNDVFSRQGWSTGAFHACEVTAHDGKRDIAEATVALGELCGQSHQGALVQWCRTGSRRPDFHIAAVVAAAVAIARRIFPGFQSGDKGLIALHFERRTAADLRIVEQAIAKDYRRRSASESSPAVTAYLVPKGSSDGLAAADLLANYAFHLARGNRLPADWPAPNIPVVAVQVGTVATPAPACPSTLATIFPASEPLAAAPWAPVNKPPPPKPAQASLGQVEHLLQAAESAERGRDFNVLQQALDGAAKQMASLTATEVDTLQFDRLRVLQAGLLQAQCNHAGQADAAAVAPDLQRAMDRMLQENRFDYAVALFHNRCAVAALDKGDWAAVERQLDDACRAYAQVSPGPFGGAALRHREIGALLGTHGQALAMLAHAASKGSDWATANQLLDDAEMRFMEAREHFDDPGDCQRQAVYIAHCHLARTWAPAADAQQCVSLAVGELEAAFGAADTWVKTWQKEPVSGSGPALAFAVATLLKAQWTGQAATSWLPGLLDDASELASLLRGQPSHPHEIVLGYLTLAWNRARGHTRRPNLFAHALAGAEWPCGLVQEISYVFLAEWQNACDGGPSPELAAQLRAFNALPEQVRRWLNREATGQPSGWLRALPFNYA